MKHCRWMIMMLPSSIATLVILMVIVSANYVAGNLQEDESKYLELGNNDMSNNNHPIRTERRYSKETYKSPRDNKTENQIDSNRETINRGTITKTKLPEKIKRRLTKKQIVSSKTPAFIKRFIPTLYNEKRVQLTGSSNVKNAKCGNSYTVKMDQKFKMILKDQQVCKIIFRAAKGTSLKYNCKKVNIEDCKNGELYISDGSIESRYCGETSKVKIKAQKASELFIAYEPSDSVGAKQDFPPDILCVVVGKKGKGYSALGKQKCPLACGKTIASAEAGPNILSEVSLPTEVGFSPATENKPQSNSSPEIFTPSGHNNILSNTASLSTLSNSSNEMDMLAQLPLLSNGSKTVGHQTTLVSNSNSERNNSLSYLMSSESSLNGSSVQGRHRRDIVRVQGGKDADASEWPWVVLLKISFGGSPIPCAGSIITPHYVLTAAHCVHDVKFEKGHKIKVIGNELNVKDQDETQKQSRGVQEIIVHPRYQFKTQRADIAMLRLNKKFIYGDGVGPICLAPDRDYEGYKVITAGWGSLTYDNDDSSEILQEATMKVDNRPECSKNYSTLPPKSNRYPVTKKHVCTSAPGIDACVGDSGGPIVVQIGTTWYQLGIVSFGFRCAEPGFSGVNTRVPNYAKWIWKTVKKDKCK